MATTLWLAEPRRTLKELKKAICDKYKAKGRATLAPEITDDKSVVMLGRIIEWKEHGVDVEADPRHVELIDLEGDGDGGVQGKRRAGTDAA